MSDNPCAICSENMEIITSEKKIISCLLCEGKMVKVTCLSRKYFKSMVVAAIIQRVEQAPPTLLNYRLTTLKKMCRSVQSVLSERRCLASRQIDT